MPKILLKEGSKILFSRLVQDSRLLDSSDLTTNDISNNQQPTSAPDSGVHQRDVILLVGAILGAVSVPIILGIITISYLRKKHFQSRSKSSNISKEILSVPETKYYEVSTTKSNGTDFNLNSTSTEKSCLKKVPPSKKLKKFNRMTPETDLSSISSVKSPPPNYTEEELNQASDMAKRRTRSPKLRRPYKSEENLIQKTFGLKRPMTVENGSRKLSPCRRRGSLGSKTFFEMSNGCERTNDSDRVTEGPLDWYARHATPDPLREDLSSHKLTGTASPTSAKLLLRQTST
ncbi:hypothetical protein BY996DRAFT_6415301 [Phakopsora pachyrhizi]|uniref:Expressed protein n=1 Tax=Phakopsora pachyrhizi TaxID=170000 RepID=A0AAV0ASB7_PHAPC|nr:hypothetical protein BY996DRAFT_6415301 [Phakopsora pachyrhizi]CAH7672337.1 expressed protein [Phakopsora pachyrhizi]